MPRFWILQLIVPVANAGKRRIHDRPFPYPAGILRSQGVADHIPDVMGDKVDIFDTKLVEIVPFTKGLRALPPSLDSMLPFGATSLNDAIARTAPSLQGRRGPRRTSKLPSPRACGTR